MGAIIRYTKTHVLVLCPLGHLIESTRLDGSFGGSMIEAELGARHAGDRFDRMAARCQGHGHKTDDELRSEGSDALPSS